MHKSEDKQMGWRRFILGLSVHLYVVHSACIHRCMHLRGGIHDYDQLALQLLVFSLIKLLTPCRLQVTLTRRSRVAW